MLRSKPNRKRQFSFVADCAAQKGYGLSLGWLNPEKVRENRAELEDTFSASTSFRRFRFEDVFDLPPKAAGLALDIGALARGYGLTPKQIGINTQLPRQTGQGHFDRNMRMAFIVPFDTSEVDIIRPTVDGIPEMHDDGRFTYVDAHKMYVPTGSLLGVGGPKSAIASNHRVSNPTDNYRYGIAIGCV